MSWSRLGDRVLYRRQRAAGRCTQCGRVAPNYYACCQRCRTHNADRKAAQRLERRRAMAAELRARGLVTLREYARRCNESTEIVQVMNMTTTALVKTIGRKPSQKQRALQQRATGNVARRSGLPEYLLPEEVNALIAAAPHGQARLIMLEQWRAGLRISEAVSLAVEDLQLDADNPTLRARLGKGSKSRLVPLHPELAAAFRQVIDFGNVRRGPLVDVSRSTAWRWMRQALETAKERGTIAAGRWASTHTLRHSAARHWLSSGVPLNFVSKWLGHASIQTTLVYLELLPDPSGYMERVS